MAFLGFLLGILSVLIFFFNLRRLFTTTSTWLLFASFSGFFTFLAYNFFCWVLERQARLNLVPDNLNVLINCALVEHKFIRKVLQQSRVDTNFWVRILIHLLFELLQILEVALFLSYNRCVHKLISYALWDLLKTLASCSLDLRVLVANLQSLDPVYNQAPVLLKHSSLVLSSSDLPCQLSLGQVHSVQELNRHLEEVAREGSLRDEVSNQIFGLIVLGSMQAASFLAK